MAAYDRFFCTVLEHSHLLFSVCRLDTLGSMQASEELDDGQVRQMLFDLESSYNAFNNVLHNN